MIKIYKRSEISTEEILERSEQTIDVEGIVTDIIKNVRENGDKALVEYSKKFDGAVDDVLEVTKEEIDAALNEVDSELIEILKQAKENITAFHSRQVRNSFVINDNAGVIIGQKVLPIEKVGLYVPGGTASYPSSVLMNCVPAKIAGCSEIVMVTPAKEGKIKPVILAAARIAEIFCMTCSVWDRISLPVNTPLAGSSAICPEQKGKFSDFTACEYGPTAAGAFFVVMISFMEKPFFNLISDTLHWILPA